MIRDLFVRVLEGFLIERQKEFKANELASLLRHDLPDAIRDKSSLTDQYKIKGSAGVGRWAEIPWIAILDKDITDTPEQEYYIVYLFDAQMNAIYLSLNQGWVQYEKKFGNNQSLARQAIVKKTRQLQQVLNSSFDFPITPIDLHATNNLGRGYQLGHICGKSYLMDQLPDDVYIIDDLRNLVGVYRELKGKAGRHILDFAPNIQEIEDVETPLTPNIKIEELRLEIIGPSLQTTRETDNSLLFDLEKTLSNQRKHKKIGDSAEKLIVEVEKTRLQKEGRHDLAAKVKIISENMSLGFDILSYEKDGTERQIEVKGTTSNNVNAFFLSAHELQKSELLSNYYLFIVHGVGTSKSVISFVKKPKFHSELFKLEPRQYLVKYCPKGKH